MLSLFIRIKLKHEKENQQQSEKLLVPKAVTDNNSAGAHRLLKRNPRITKVSSIVPSHKHQFTESLVYLELHMVKKKKISALYFKCVAKGKKDLDCQFQRRYLLCPKAVSTWDEACITFRDP